MQTRIERVLEELKSMGLSQMMVSDPVSIRYLTEVSVWPGERLFALYLDTDGRQVLFLNNLFHVEKTGLEEVWFSDTDDQIGLLASVIRRDQPLGIDKEWPARFLIPLMEACPDMTPVLASDAVDNCRARKDAEEIRLMKISSQINDEVIEKAFAYLKEGMTEKELAAYIDSEYRKAGCEDNSFPTIVSFGKNAADPHHMPDDTVVQPGDCVLIDMGCVKDRYCSDMTRTGFFQEASEEFTKIHDLVREANELAEKAVRPGVVLKDIDKIARDHIRAGGFDKEFNHRLGHFIGQVDHEKGDVSAISEIVAAPGMVFSIEPGVYLEGRFGVRVEDLVLVTEEGCEILNQVDKHWQIIQ